MEIEDQPLKKNQNQVWVEKYRPPSLKELISHDSIIQTCILNYLVMRFIQEKRLPNLLFYGPPGTGKTSTIVACAKELYQKQYGQMVLELNASDERGINVVREQIKNFASMQTISFTKQEQIKNIKKINQVDHSRRGRQYDQSRLDGVKKKFKFNLVMEKYARSTRFCMICNYQSKIIPALQSRCTKFKFKQIPFQDALNRVMEICNSEKIQVEESGQFFNLGIKSIFKLCDGDMRKIVNMLQSIQISLQGQKIKDQVINEQFIHKLTGTATQQDMKDILSYLFNLSINEAYESIFLTQKYTKLNYSRVSTFKPQLKRFLKCFRIPNYQIKLKYLYINDQQRSSNYFIQVSKFYQLLRKNLISQFNFCFL